MQKCFLNWRKRHERKSPRLSAKGATETLVELRYVIVLVSHAKHHQDLRIPKGEEGRVSFKSLDR